MPDSELALNLIIYSLKEDYEFKFDILGDITKFGEIIISYKEHGILIALENGYSLNDLGLLTSIDDMAHIAEFVDGLSFLLDIGHFILNSPLQNIRKQLENYPHLQFSAIHLHDNKQKADDHLSLGEGILLRQEKELKAILRKHSSFPRWSMELNRAFFGSLCVEDTGIYF